MVKEQLPEVDKRNIIVEPINRNTAPSVAWAAMRIQHQAPDANIIVSPSDQLILNETAFAGMHWRVFNASAMCALVARIRTQRKAA